MRRLAAIAVLAAAASAAHAQDADSPLFADFKAFCVATGANPNAIKTAAEAAGLKPHDPSGGSTTWPFPMTVTMWEHETPGATITLSTGSTRVPPRTGQPSNDFDDCTLNIHPADVAGASEIQHWIGVPPERVEPSQSSLTLSFFDFQDDGGRHAPLPPDREDSKAAEASGYAWHVVLIQSMDGSSVQLIDDLPVSGASN
jgi:hypothetical protein